MMHSYHTGPSASSFHRVAVSDGSVAHIAQALHHLEVGYRRMGKSELSACGKHDDGLRYTGFVSSFERCILDWRYFCTLIHPRQSTFCWTKFYRVVLAAHRERHVSHFML